MIFFGIFLYICSSNMAFGFLFWVVLAMIPVYYFEVKKNVNEFYNAKNRELNIPYESDQQREAREREQTVQRRVDQMRSSGRWDEEAHSRRYSCCEVLCYLVYYFVMSLFPGYIEKQLDIFQREHALLASQK
mmetsp:Transcript_2424/g.3147  ORF Transcript_2424/g.3147 Transcript_2424/m.3147 type:complete len:132 (-) Transcript_2424:1860-2255(-)